MWDKLLSWARFLWDAGQKSEQTSRQLSEAQDQIQKLAELNKFLYAQIQHERELRQQEIASLRRELADSQEKIELRLRLEISEKLRQLPRGE